MYLLSLMPRMCTYILSNSVVLPTGRDPKKNYFIAMDWLTFSMMKNTITKVVVALYVRLLSIFKTDAYELWMKHVERYKARMDKEHPGNKGAESVLPFLHAFEIKPNFTTHKPSLQKKNAWHK